MCPLSCNCILDHRVSDSWLLDCWNSPTYNHIMNLIIIRGDGKKLKTMQNWCYRENSFYYIIIIIQICTGTESLYSPITISAQENPFFRLPYTRKMLLLECQTQNNHLIKICLSLQSYRTSQKQKQQQQLNFTFLKIN